MANYIVGDIQGCFDELERLLDRVDFSPSSDTLWLAGDLVARGPKSLETLELVMSLGSSAKTVLGNHDLHLLALILGLYKARKKDKTASIIHSPKRDKFAEWIRFQPLLLEHPNFILTHAGISPQWDIPTAKTAAKEVESILQSERWAWLIEGMYADEPSLWREDLEGIERYRYIINAFTRMRYCFPNGSLDMDCKLPPKDLEKSTLVPWFTWEKRIQLPKTLLFGHWAALEGYQGTDVIGLDTGCVWGGELTMLEWETQRYITQPALTQ
ncbi:symmetrical bis(5'-nucleosyl)-tetraphosphatase [Vibrio sp. RC27]